MKLIKSRGLLIGKEKFQLIGPAGQKSREINLKQTSKKKIAYTSERAIRKGIDSIWAGGHTGTESSIKMDFAKKTHKKFIHLLNLNTKEKKNVLIIGPGHGFEAKYITENIPDVTIDTFDIVREISKEYKKYISKKGIHVNVGGLENYNNKEMIGKYDGITAVFSAGFHVEEENIYRNILKIGLMLKPNGFAQIKIKSKYHKDSLIQFRTTLQKFNLNKMFTIKFTLIAGDPFPNLILTRK